MKRQNLPLIFGGFILIVLFIVVLFPHNITHINPYGVQSIRSVYDRSNVLSVQGAPFSPSSEDILGTDNIGRDVLSFIVYGTRLTLTLGLFVVLGRFLIAIPLGITAGFGNKFFRGIISQMSIIISAIPVLLISIIILGLGFFASLDRNQSIVAFVFVLTIVDFAKLAVIIMERVENILAKSFIIGERAIGKSDFKIAVENVIPHLSTELIILFFMEFSRALTIIMELGVFGIFIGNLRFIQSSEGGLIKAMNLSFEPEWASMLATSRYYITSAPWIVLSPAAAFFISILGFNLFGEGLKKMLEKRDSKFIVNVRKIVSFNIKSFFKINKNKNNKKRLIILSSLIILAFILIINIINEGARFKSSEVSSLLKSDYKDGVIIGSSGAVKASSNIADAFKKLGLKPIDGINYISEYKTDDIYVNYSSKINIIDTDNKSRSMIKDKDFKVMSFADCDSSGKVFDGASLDLFNIKDFTKFENYFIMVDGNLYNKEFIENFSEKLSTDTKVKGILYILPKGAEFQDTIGSRKAKGTLIGITAETASVLLKNKSYKINVNLKNKKLNNTGRNIMGMIQGSDNKVGKDAIIIGLPYNFSPEDKEIGLKRISFGLELMRKLTESKTKMNRTIILAMWDGTLNDDFSGLKYYAESPIYPMDKCEAYVDLTKINIANIDTLELGLAQAPITRYFSWSFANQLKRKMESKGVRVSEYPNVRTSDIILAKGPNVDEMMYYKDAIPTIIIANKKEELNKNISFDDFGEMLLKNIEDNNY